MLWCSKILQNNKGFQLGLSILSSGLNLHTAESPSNPKIDRMLAREAKSNNWRRSFEELENKVYSSDRFTSLTNNESLRRSNSSLNRYPNVSAYDHSRVILTHNDEDLYINANLVKSSEANREYILTQGPLKHTVDDFWLMVWQNKCPTVVMLCNCVENGISKSWTYWPIEVGHTMVLGEDREGLDIEVSLVHEKDRGYFLIRSFVVKNCTTGEKRTVEQFHYLEWPDFNVPKSPKHFLEFLFAIRDSGCFSKSSGPPIVHCSAGIGRSGTLILVDTCLVLASQDTDLTLKRVFDTLMELRTYRRGLIQTEQQLKFSVDAILQGLNDLEIVDKETACQNGKRSNDNIEGDENDSDYQQNRKKRKNSSS